MSIGFALNALERAVYNHRRMADEAEAAMAELVQVSADIDPAPIKELSDALKPMGLVVVARTAIRQARDFLDGVDIYEFEDPQAYRDLMVALDEALELP